MLTRWRTSQRSDILPAWRGRSSTTMLWPRCATSMKGPEQWLTGFLVIWNVRPASRPGVGPGDGGGCERPRYRGDRPASLHRGRLAIANVRHAFWRPNARPVIGSRAFDIMPPQISGIDVPLDVNLTGLSTGCAVNCVQWAGQMRSPISAGGSAGIAATPPRYRAVPLLIPPSGHLAA